MRRGARFRPSQVLNLLTEPEKAITVAGSVLYRHGRFLCFRFSRAELFQRRAAILFEG